MVVKCLGSAELAKYARFSSNSHRRYPCLPK